VADDADSNCGEWTGRGVAVGRHAH
jgi:hypothetical protein